VVVESTGIASVGARHAYEAICEGSHVVMVTVEADAVVGPTLAELADMDVALDEESFLYRLRRVQDALADDHLPEEHPLQ